VYTTAVSSHPVSTSTLRRSLVVAAALAVAGLIAVAVFSPWGHALGPAPVTAGRAWAHTGYFRDPGTHALPRVTTPVTRLHQAGGAAPQPRP
jgi:hypothetical protein